MRREQVTTEGVGGDEHLSGHMGRAWRNYTLQDLRVQLQKFAKDRCKLGFAVAE